MKRKISNNKGITLIALIITIIILLILAVISIQIVKQNGQGYNKKDGGKKLLLR